MKQRADTRWILSIVNISARKLRFNTVSEVKHLQKLSTFFRGWDLNATEFFTRAHAVIFAPAEFSPGDIPVDGRDVYSIP